MVALVNNMSVHCLIKTEKYLIAKDIEEDLKDIIHRKFNDLLTLECHIADNEICDWELRYDLTHRFPVSLKDNKKLEFTHPYDAWSYWAQAVVEDELTIKYDGKMLDEEYPQKELKPAPECHETFQKYLEITTHHSQQWKQALIAIELSRLPADLKKL